MTKYLAQTTDEFLPARIGRQLGKTLDRMDAQAIAARRADQLAIERAVETTERGMVGITRIALREAALNGTAPHAAARLRAAADNGSAVVIGRIIEAGL
jgi:DNA-directed RNA polymerase subunit K/omega